MMMGATVVSAYEGFGTIEEQERQQSQQRRRLGGWSQVVKDDRCPTDDAFPDSCLQHVMPPYPICTRQTAAAWVQKAHTGYDHCCNGDDLSTCTCPQKNSDRFKAKIQDYCSGVETCWSSEMKHVATSAVTSKERLQAEP